MCKSTKTTRSQAGHVNGCKGNLPGKVRAGRKEDKLKPKQLKRKIEKFVFQHELFLGDHPITPYELEQLTQSKNTAEILSLLTISSGDCLPCLKITPSQALSIPACDLVAPYARGIAFSKLAAVTYTPRVGRSCFFSPSADTQCRSFKRNVDQLVFRCRCTKKSRSFTNRACSCRAWRCSPR